MRQSLSCEIYSKSFGGSISGQEQKPPSTFIRVETKCENVYSKTDTDIMRGRRTCALVLDSKGGDGGAVCKRSFCLF